MSPVWLMRLAGCNMSGYPTGSNPCCPQRDDRVTPLKIGARGIVVGLLGLELVFQQLYTLGRLPEEVSDAELLALARRFNYIPRQAAAEADYALALREAYARFCASLGQDFSQARR